MACRLVPPPEASTTIRNGLTYGVSAAGGDDRDVLERELAVRGLRIAKRVLAREAGVAVLLARRADRLVDRLHREVGERVRAELLGDLLDRPVVRDHLLARRHVDAVVAGVADRRGRDPEVDLL